MAYSSLAVANAFLDLARQGGQPLTNMQLQKLVYIAHGYSLALLERPLFFHNVHAWQWGPVIPKLYKPLRKYGAEEVTEAIPTTDEAVPADSEEMDVIRAVWETYGHFTGSKLSGMTHREGSPWSKTWTAEPYEIISNESIGEYYRTLLDERPERAEVSI